MTNSAHMFFNRSSHSGNDDTLCRLTGWVSDNMMHVYKNEPATYLATVLIQKLVPRQSSCGLASLIDSMTDVQVDGRPLLVAAALHRVGHVLAKEVAIQMPNFVNDDTREKLLVVFSKFATVLKSDTLGCMVLKALHGLV